MKVYNNDGNDEDNNKHNSNNYITTPVQVTGHSAQAGLEVPGGVVLGRWQGNGRTSTPTIAPG